MSEQRIIADNIRIRPGDITVDGHSLGYCTRGGSIRVIPTGDCQPFPLVQLTLVARHVEAEGDEIDGE